MCVRLSVCVSCRLSMFCAHERTVVVLSLCNLRCFRIVCSNNRETILSSAIVTLRLVSLMNTDVVAPVKRQYVKLYWHYYYYYYYCYK